MNTPIIAQEKEHATLQIILNHPQKCNALSPELIFAFQESLHAALTDDSIKVILLRGNGKHFCAGADIHHMRTMCDATEEENERHAQWLTQLFDLIYQSKKPVIACAHGHIFGGGLGLLAAADIVLASDEAQFCFPEVSIGLVPATIAPFIIKRIGYQAAKHFMLSAQRFDAPTAHRIQLVDELVSAEKLITQAMQLAATLSKHDAHALTVTKQWLNELDPINKAQCQKASHLLAQIRTTDETKRRLDQILKK